MKKLFIFYIVFIFDLAFFCGFSFAQEQPGTYSARGALDIDQGTVFVWMKFDPLDDQGLDDFSFEERSDHPYPVFRRDHLVFQTDDSRLALFVDTFFSNSMDREIVRIGARAGGNRRHVDSDYKTGNFPEASIIIDNDGELGNYRHAWYSPAIFPEGEWQFVVMTWQGYPEGVVKIYLNGELKGQKPYSRDYDDGRPLFEKYSVGYRPPEWVGELREGEDIRPITEMFLEQGGIEIRDLRFYRICLSEEEIKDAAQNYRESDVFEDFLY